MMNKQIILALAAAGSAAATTCPSTQPANCVGNADGSFCYWPAGDSCFSNHDAAACAMQSAHGAIFCSGGAAPVTTTAAPVTTTAVAATTTSAAPCATVTNVVNEHVTVVESVTSVTYVTVTAGAAAPVTTTAAATPTTTTAAAPTTTTASTTSTFVAPTYTSAPVQGGEIAISYLTSWGSLTGAEEALLTSKGNGYLLSFGQWDANGDLTFSEGVADVPEYDPYYIQAKSQMWIPAKFANPDQKMLVAFGGQTYEGIWSFMETDEQRQRLANKLVNLLNTDFPVYKKGATASELVGDCQSFNYAGECDFGVYQKVGSVQLDGLDFDFEKAARITEQENRNLEDLISRIRAQIGYNSGKVLSLTTYHVGSDPVECLSNTVFEVNGRKCSYIENARSIHYGEITSLLKNTVNEFDFFNVMTYDAGVNFLYQESMWNFAAALGDRKKVVLGNTINSQWAPKEQTNGAGSFVESREQNMARTAWAKHNGFGGFFQWALGASSGHSMPFAEQMQYFNEMTDVWFSRN